MSENDAVRIRSEFEGIKKRLKVLEEDCAPFRIGKDPRFLSNGIFYPECPDYRPYLSLHKIAKILMEHCGLEFEHIPAKSESFKVKKVKK